MEDKLSSVVSLLKEQYFSSEQMLSNGFLSDFELSFYRGQMDGLCQALDALSFYFDDLDILPF